MTGSYSEGAANYLCCSELKSDGTLSGSKICAQNIIGADAQDVLSKSVYKSANGKIALFYMKGNIVDIMEI